MTMLPIWKTCKKCGQVYSWNPDVGMISCPNCKVKMAKSVLKIILKMKGV